MTQKDKDILDAMDIIKSKIPLGWYADGSAKHKLVNAWHYLKGQLS